MTDKELFDAYKMDIYRTCFYMLKHKQDAEDLCHEIFIKIFQKDFNSIEKLKPWILSITMNECRNYLKKKSRTLLLNDFGSWAQNMISPEKVETQVEKNENRKELCGFIYKLRPKIQEVIILKYLHSLKNEEVANILNIPVGTVKSRASKGLNLLRQMMGNEKDNIIRVGAVE